MYEPSLQSYIITLGIVVVIMWLACVAAPRYIQGPPSATLNWKKSLALELTVLCAHRHALRGDVLKCGDHIFLTAHVSGACDRQKHLFEWETGQEDGGEARNGLRGPIGERTKEMV